MLAADAVCSWPDVGHGALARFWNDRPELEPGHKGTHHLDRFVLERHRTRHRHEVGRSRPQQAELVRQESPPALGERRAQGRLAGARRGWQSEGATVALEHGRMQHQEAMHAQGDDEVEAPFEHRQRLLGRQVLVRYAAIYGESHVPLRPRPQSPDVTQREVAAEDLAGL
jgi:hypothetical protein